MNRQIRLALFSFVVFFLGTTHSWSEEKSMKLNVLEQLAAGKETVRIGCMGDSITGIYYHSGGRGAWGDMLSIGLQKVYPLAKIEIINHGQSSAVTADGVKWVEYVLGHKPQLMVVMYGMNDVVRVRAETYRSNLVQIVKQCREKGTEVVLCTPTAAEPDSYHPIAKMEQYCDIVRSIGKEQGVPVADCYRAFDGIRVKDPRAWMLMMSDAIHPNMRGHKVIAECVVEAITGKRLSLADVPPPWPMIPFTLQLLASNQNVKVIAMPPYDDLIRRGLQVIKTNAQVEVTAWPIEGKSLAEVEAWSKGIRDAKPNLVVIAIPANLAGEKEDQTIRSCMNTIQNAISRGRQTWDCIVVLPSVAKTKLSDNEKNIEALEVEVTKALHIGMVAREAKDSSSAQELLARWLGTQSGPGPQ